MTETMSDDGKTSKSKKAKSLPRHVVEEVDIYGNVRLYFRKGHGPRIRFSSRANTDAFWIEYAAAIAGKATPAPTKQRPVKKGTFRALVIDYMASAEFTMLDPTTQSQRRRVIESMLLERLKPDTEDTIADVPLDLFSAQHVRLLRDRKASAPEAANHRLKTLGPLFKWAIADRRIETNFARDVPKFKTGSPGHHTWSEEEVEAYMRRHPPGSKAFVTLALLLFTGQRISDVAVIGRGNVTPDDKGRPTLTLTQRKNRRRAPVRLVLPILDVLSDALVTARDLGSETFLVTEYGKPFSVKGLGNKFRDWCDEAELTHCSAHGLRKAGATIAAENGATEYQLMAIFGWADPKQAAGYVRKARQKKLAGDAMHLILAPAKNPSDSDGGDASEGKTTHKLLKLLERE